MTNQTKRRWFFICAAMILAALVVSVGVFSARRYQSSPQQAGRVNYMPQILSKVKKIEIVRSWIENSGTEHAGVAIEVRND